MEEVGIPLKKANIHHMHFIKNVLKNAICGLHYMARNHRFRQEERVSVAFKKGNYASVSYWSSLTVAITEIFRNPLTSEIMTLQTRTF